MSLSYQEVYNIVGGVFIAFNGKAHRRLLSIKHSEKKRNSLVTLFPTDYYSWTKENFIVANLYVNFVKSPSSMIGAIEMLSEIDEKEIFRFKDQIINYRKYLKEDIYRMRIEHGTAPGLPALIKEYRENKIQWYTFYFYLIVSGEDLKQLSASRINGFLLKKIQKLLLYVTFSEKSMLSIKELLQDQIQI